MEEEEEEEEEEMKEEEEEEEEENTMADVSGTSKYLYKGSVCDMIAGSHG